MRRHDQLLVMSDVRPITVTGLMDRERCQADKSNRADGQGEMSGR